MNQPRIADLKSKLDLIEARLQSVIEGGITLLLPIGNPQQVLTHHLVEAIQADLVVSPDGQIITAPSTFNIYIHPSQLGYWQSHQSFLDILVEELSRAGNEAGFHFRLTPHIVIITNPDISTNDLRVTAVTNQIDMGETSGQVFDIKPWGFEKTDAIPSNAFLIVNGSRHFPLNQAVINIGRRLDNHLVIDDPRVSRSHVQLRTVKGRYVLFDLNSTGGTFVNGQRINQYILNPGDVISLAGFPLIYGQDLTTNLAETGSLPRDPEGKNGPNRFS